MRQLKKPYIRYQKVFRYILSGGLTTVVNIAVFILFDTVFNMPYLIANAISIIVAILFAFFINKIYVFKTESPTFKMAFKEFYLFVGLRLISGLFDILSIWIFVDFVNLATNFSKILTQFIIVISNYIFSKLYIFK